MKRGDLYMGFADELRNAPSRKKQEENLKRNKEKLQQEQDWEHLTEVFIQYIKEECRCVASAGKKQCDVYLRDWIERLDEKYTEKYTSSNDYYGWNHEIEFETSDEGRRWQRMRDKFFHYICGHKSGDDTYEYPFYFGMSKEEAVRLATELKKRLTTEGLAVEEQLRKEYCKVHYSNGREIIDEWRFSFYLRITW